MKRMKLRSNGIALINEGKARSNSPIKIYDPKNIIEQIPICEYKITSFDNSKIIIITMSELSKSDIIFFIAYRTTISSPERTIIFEDFNAKLTKKMIVGTTNLLLYHFLDFNCAI